MNEMISSTDRKKYLRDNFIGVKLDQRRIDFLSIDWKYVYTLNLDDGIERNSPYSFVIGPMRAYQDGITEDEKCVIKVHGDAREICAYKEGEEFCILDTEQYVRSLKKNRAILDRLSHDYVFDNILFIGCSLDDELDLLKVFAESIEYTSSAGIKGVENHRYFITEKKVNKLQQIDLQKYGVDTIVYVDSYDSFYEAICAYAKKAKETPSEKIDIYAQFKWNDLDAQESENNKYYYYGKKLYDIKKNVITYPYYLVERGVVGTILMGFPDKPVTLLCGTRVSGKTVCLIQIARAVRDRIVYYFDSRTSVNKSTLEELLSQRNTLFLFDTTVLSSECVRYAIKNAYQLRKNNSNIVIAINRSDHDIIGCYHAEDNHYVSLVNVNNKFSDDEYREINKRLAQIPLIPFSAPQTSILDNLINAAKNAAVVHKYKYESIRVDTVEKLCLYILLATFEKVDDQQLVDYALVRESASVSHQENNIFDNYYTFPFERTIVNNVQYRLICNAQFWLFSELRNYADNVKHESIIVDAYRYLIKQALENSREKNRYKSVEGIIKVDVLNQIFSVRGGGNRRIVQRIYESLSDLLSDSYQYHHQFAKCLLWSHSNTMETLKTALVHAQNALQQVEDRLRQVKGEYASDGPLEISRAHICFTICLIYAGISELEGRKNTATIELALNMMEEALSNKYNQDAIREIREGKKESFLSKFIEWLVGRNDWEQSGLNRRKAETVVNRYYKAY